jgi:hypothetical protein
MEENENTLKKAVEALKNEQFPPGPPQELVNATVTRLAETQGQSDKLPLGSGIGLVERLRAVRGITRFAAAAVLFIVAGYAVGRLSGPRPPDMEQLQAALEPAIRQNLLDETKRYLQLDLANGYVRIKDELSQQYRQDLNRVALQSVAASNAVTNELLTELIESINEAQNQDRQWVAAAFDQIESNRLHDRTQFGNALATFAMQTEDELMRTKQEMAHFLSYTQPGLSIPDEIGNLNNPTERTEK